MPPEPQRPIPVSAAERIAKDYGYDQVAIVARRVGDAPDPNGEHVTTYGVDPENCNVAGRIGMAIKHHLMKWPHPIFSEGRKVRVVTTSKSIPQLVMIDMGRVPTEDDLQALRDFLMSEDR